MLTYSHVGGVLPTVEAASCGMEEGRIELESIDRPDLEK